jgi:O-antigen/teichoic acid export membrane protein
LVLTLLFVVVLNRKVEGIYEAQIIGTLVYLLLFLPLIIRNSTLHFEISILKKMLNFSFPLVLSSSFGVFLGIADRYSLNFISGLTSVGIYALGYKLANTLKIFVVTSVQLALTPTVFRMVDKPEIKRFLSKIMTYFTFGLMFCALGVSLFGQEAVKLMTAKQPEYWGAYTVIPFIAMGIVFGMMKDNLSYGLQIAKKTGIIASIIIGVSLLNITLNILLIPLVGTLGAALATLVSQILYFTIMLHYAQKYYPVRYEFKKVFLSVGLGAMLCLLAWLICDWSLTWRLIIKTILLFSYPAILYLFRCYDKAELQALRGFWQKWKNPQEWKEHLQNLKS